MLTDINLVLDLLVHLCEMRPASARSGNSTCICRAFQRRLGTGFLACRQRKPRQYRGAMLLEDHAASKWAMPLQVVVSHAGHLQPRLEVT